MAAREALGKFGVYLAAKDCYRPLRLGARDHAALAWFIASLATVGGALGAGLASDEAVREAAYASAPSDEPAVRPS